MWYLVWALLVSAFSCCAESGASRFYENRSNIISSSYKTVAGIAVKQDRERNDAADRQRASTPAPFCKHMAGLVQAPSLRTPPITWVGQDSSSSYCWQSFGSAEHHNQIDSAQGCPEYERAHACGGLVVPQRLSYWRAQSLLKQPADQLRCMIIAPSERAMLDRCTVEQWSAYLNKGGHHHDPFTLYSLYQFPLFMQYLATRPDYEQSILNLGATIQDWYGELASANGAYYAEHLRCIITDEYQRIEREHVQAERQRLHDTVHKVHAERSAFAADFESAQDRLHAGDTTTKSDLFIIDDKAALALHELRLNVSEFKKCTGTVAQLQHHAEVVFLANQFGRLSAERTTRELAFTMYGFVDVARECTRDDNVESGRIVTEFCWEVLTYVHAVAAGVCDGVNNAEQWLTNPADTVQSACTSAYRASGFIIGFIGDVVQCGLACRYAEQSDYRGNNAQAYRAWDALAKKCVLIGDAVRAIVHEVRATSGPERVRLLATLGTEYYITGKAYCTLARSVAALFDVASGQANALAQDVKRSIFIDDMTTQAMQEFELHMATQVVPTEGMSIIECVASPVL